MFTHAMHQSCNEIKYSSGKKFIKFSNLIWFVQDPKRPSKTVITTLHVKAQMMQMEGVQNVESFFTKTLKTMNLGNARS